MLMRRIFEMADEDHKTIYHPVTGEPIFNIHYGEKQHTIDWHPFQKEHYPNLKSMKLVGSPKSPTGAPARDPGMRAHIERKAVDLYTEFAKNNMNIEHTGKAFWDRGSIRPDAANNLKKPEDRTESEEQRSNRISSFHNDLLGKNFKSTEKHGHFEQVPLQAGGQPFSNGAEWEHIMANHGYTLDYNKGRTFGWKHQQHDDTIQAVHASHWEGAPWTIKHKY